MHILTTFSLVLLLQLTWSVIADNVDDGERAEPAQGPNYSLYNFVMNDLQGKLVNFKQFQGKVILVVNVASECGFTDGHYKGLQKLQDLLVKSERFSVIGFPCNQFGDQEPGSDKEIYEFATKTYGVTFPLMSKANVIEKKALPIWKLIERTTGQAPNWNFWKYLVDYQGNVINFWGPWSTVEEITPFVKEAVDQAIKENARKRQANEAAGMPSTESQNQANSLPRASPLPLNRARPPPPPKMPSVQAEAPPPPPKGTKPAAKAPPPPPKGTKPAAKAPPSSSKGPDKSSKTEL